MLGIFYGETQASKIMVFIIIYCYYLLLIVYIDRMEKKCMF